ncbi:type II secretion system protein, partial [Chloroflexota bacterium]
KEKDMQLLKKGEKGFTLIELLIVVAILGVLAAVVIPNVSRFIGRGETEAGETELSNIQSAVTAMMTDNGISTLPNPVGVATDDMGAFPDATSACETDKINDPTGNAYTNASDLDGFILFGHDVTADAAATPLVNYVATETTQGTYTVDANGTVTQVTTGYE